jgi:CRP-like cAMP-binding protein
MPLAPPPLPIPLSLDDVGPECLEYLLGQACTRVVNKSEVLVKQGSPSQYTYFVNQGLFVVGHCSASDAREFDPSRFVVRGQVLYPAVHSVSCSGFEARAVTQGIVTQLPSDILWEACHTWPDLARGLLSRALLRGLEESQWRSLRLALSLDQHLATFFWSLANPSPSGPAGSRPFPYKVPQALLARYLGTSREEIGRHLSHLDKLGLLQKTPEGYLVESEMSALIPPGPHLKRTPEFIGASLVSCPQMEELLLANRCPGTEPLSRAFVTGRSSASLGI